MISEATETVSGPELTLEPPRVSLILPCGKKLGNESLEDNHKSIERVIHWLDVDTIYLTKATRGLGGCLTGTFKPFRETRVASEVPQSGARRDVLRRAEVNDRTRDDHHA